MKITCQSARNIREFRELMDSDPQEVSFVRNQKDWTDYCKGRDCGYHPLEALSDKEMVQFSKSLKFGDRGIQQVRCLLFVPEVVNLFNLD